LLALQDMGFWSDLNGEWRSGGELESWAYRYNVRDAWLAEAVAATLRFWSEHPDSPEANLQGSRWFAFQVPSIHPFRPHFESMEVIPFDELLIPGSGVEVDKRITECLAKQTTAFHAQQRAYADALKTAFRVTMSNASRDHCSWTAAYQCGASYVDIADARDARRHAVETVKKSIHRFARRIGLTLAGTRNTAICVPSPFGYSMRKTNQWFSLDGLGPVVER
jgi:hypothetical protein